MELKNLDLAAAKWPRVAIARQLFREAHDSIKQVRKYTGEPYWVHTEDVADSHLHYFPDDENGAIICLGHDYKEDVVTKLTEEKRFEELAAFNLRLAALGPEVDAGINDLTDEYVKEKYPELNRAKRKIKEIERMERLPIPSKNRKLLDMISNTVSIVAHDKDFARVYLREKEAALYVLMDADGRILARAGQQVWEARGILGMPQPYLKSNV